MKKYKIGDVAKIVGIPVENIRFFESRGLLLPEKDEFSKYRYYDTEDINRLFDYLKYRNTGFSSSETISAVNEGDLDSVANIIQNKKEEAEKSARYYELKALKLHNYEKVIKSIPLYIGSYPIVMRPAGYYFIQRQYTNGTFTFKKASDFEGIFEHMMDQYVFVENMFLIKQEWINQPENENNFEWGFTIKKKWADALEIPLDQRFEVIEPKKSIYTVLDLEEGVQVDSHILKPVLEYMKIQGYILDGDVFGNLLLITHEKDRIVRYMEIWVPIKE